MQEEFVLAICSCRPAGPMPGAQIETESIMTGKPTLVCEE